MEEIVSYPEAVCEFGLWVLDFAVSEYLPSLANGIDRFKEQIQGICHRNQAPFQQFEFFAVRSRAIVSWLTHPAQEFPPERMGTLQRLYRENMIANYLSETGFWVLFFLEKRDQDEMVLIFRKYQKEYQKIHSASMEPNVAEKLKARIEQVFTGKYEPQGHVSFVEADVMNKWMDDYRKQVTEPECVGVLYHAKLNERAVQQLIEFTKISLYKGYRGSRDFLKGGR